MESASIIEMIATVCFALAVLHTFSVKLFQHLALKFPSGSVGENTFHLLGEIEVVFGIWAAVFLVFSAIFSGTADAVSYLESRNFTEPLFVFVIMVVCSSRPILKVAGQVMDAVSGLLPFNPGVSFFLTTLVVGPLLGSVITEPAAITVTALILLDRLFMMPVSIRLKYAAIGLLFVNISIGGTLTPYAAPPVLMVARVWDWDLIFMMKNFGWKAVLAVLASTSLIAFRFKSELSILKKPLATDKDEVPHWVTALHLLILLMVVASSHHPTVFVGIFLFFLGLANVTKEYQSDLKIREGLLVSFFLGGLVILGGPQRWWLEPILGSLDAFKLYFASMGLTAITDNAALTYLGSQVPSLSDASKYALVAGSVVGGGLTVIANAPNPAGFGILNNSFGEEGISPLGLFTSALVPTMIAAICFWFL